MPQLDVTENLLLGDMPTVVPGVIDWGRAHREARRMLEQLGFVDIDVRARVDRLGLSQRQMVEIAKALRGQPRVLILDEPSAVLSTAELERLFAVLHTIRASGTTIIYISHRLDEVFRIADRITVLKDGLIVGTVEPARIDQPGLIRMMVGRPLSEIYPVREARPGPADPDPRTIGRTGLPRRGPVARRVRDRGVVRARGLRADGAREGRVRRHPDHGWSCTDERDASPSELALGLPEVRHRDARRGPSA